MQDTSLDICSLRYIKTSIKTSTKIVQGSRDGSAKKNGNKGRLVATNAMEHPLLHHFDAGPSFHFGTHYMPEGILRWYECMGGCVCVHTHTL